MKKNKLLIKILFLLLFVINFTNAQAQNGLNFQGVARSSDNVVLASQYITLKLTILQGPATAITKYIENRKIEYIEIRKVKTNAQGLFNVVIGDTGALNTVGKFSDIDWKLTPKFLKTEIDPAAGSKFITMGVTQFQYVAYAKYAYSVLADNILGVLPVTKGGTGVNNLPNLKTALSLDKVNNTPDSLKPISKLTQTALNFKLNIEDSTKTYVTPFHLSKYNFPSSGTTIDTISLYNQLSLKLNSTDTITLLKKSDTLNISNRLNLKLNISDSTNGYVTPSQLVANKFDSTSLSNRINFKLNSADTSS